MRVDSVVHAVYVLCMSTQTEFDNYTAVFSMSAIDRAEAELEFAVNADDLGNYRVHKANARTYAVRAFDQFQGRASRVLEALDTLS